MTPQQRTASSTSIASNTELVANGGTTSTGSTSSSLSAVAEKELADHSLFFLSESAARTLPSFQYQGQDLSFTYKYVLSPLAEWCVQRLTPKSIAPNTITLTGLIFMIAAYASMWYFVPMLLLLDETPASMNSVPRWVFLLNAISILIYQTLDNMDGKQARRVGASSPLGLLFDHGCDAVNSVFGSANWMVAMALSPNTNDLWLCFIMLMGPYALFYISTWEEYYTGQLIMPIMNGPNEGLLGAVGMSLVSYWHGPAYWHTDTWWRSTMGPALATLLPGWNIAPLRNADMLVLSCSVGFVQEVALKTVSVVRDYGARTTLNLLPFVTLISCSLVVGLTDANIWLNMPRTSLHLCAVLFVEMTTELMLQHMTHQKFQPCRWILLPLVVFTLAVASGNWPNNVLSTAEFLLLYVAAAGTFLLLKTIILIHEICFVLNIWCFDIVTPRTRRAPSAMASNGPHTKAA